MKNGRVVKYLQAFMLLGTGLLAYAQAGGDSVDSSELQRASGPVEFISNTALPDRIDTREQILELGSGPGRIVRQGAVTAGSTARYFVIHRLHPPEFDKLDADIFGLGAGAAVDTIANLRLIIQGYLQASYNYSAADAQLLAEYITIYNAVYRQNRPYFERRFKTPLLSDLTAGREGIALHYSQWPGQTLMLIPLMTAAAGSISAIDTSAITDQTVIDKMREDPDKGIESRQAIVDFKEREAETAEQAAMQQRQANIQEEKRIAEEKARLESEQKKAAEERARIEAEKARAEAERASAEKERERLEKAEAAGTLSAEDAAKLAKLREADSPEARAAAEAKLQEAEAAAAAKEAELAKSAADLEKRQAELEKNKEAAQESAEFAERKAVEAQRDREAIAGDQRELIAAAPVEQPSISGVLAVRLGAQAKPSGTVVKVNPSSGLTLQSSALTQVSARTLTVTGGKTIAVAASDGKTRLIEIDPSTLQSLKQGADELNANTQIWISGADIYAITVSGGKNYLARFDINFAKQAESRISVHPWAAVNFDGDRVITQDEKGAVVFLKVRDLSE